MNPLRQAQTTLVLLSLISSPWQMALGDDIGVIAASTCLNCHTTKQTGFGPAHSFGAYNCISCHAGDNTADTENGAHEDLIAFPGNLDNAGRACGTCHAGRVAAVAENLMYTATGMVHTTRQIVDEFPGAGGSTNLQSLGHGAADSMLRKLCASCHIGQQKAEHKLDVMRDRGGGCLACHINDYPDDAHPSLTTNVSDARCFGCHSRSGRISLNYTGLAEIDAPDTGARLRLPDGRHVEQIAADVHYRAGMACIDCHTSVGLMGAAAGAGHQRQAVDIACSDCHDNRNRQISIADWPANLNSMKKHVLFDVSDNTVFLATGKNATPLWNVEIRGDGLWLHTKNSGRTLKVPGLDPANHSDDGDHERLECAACHSQWVSQCFGCHMEYDADGSQWDHVEKAVTPGRWNERRCHIRNEPGTLGVNDQNRIEVFVPGMVMTVAHPDWSEEKFVRMFAPLSPHTTGESRTCKSCHRSSVALGLGEGEITERAGEFHFEPTRELLQDGLPADAWTNIERSLGGDSPVPGHRPLGADEMKTVLEATLP
jgi:hypothetical protein